MQVKGSFFTQVSQIQLIEVNNTCLHVIFYFESCEHHSVGKSKTVHFWLESVIHIGKVSLAKVVKLQTEIHDWTTLCLPDYFFVEEGQLKHKDENFWIAQLQSLFVKLHNKHFEQVASLLTAQQTIVPTQVPQ